MFLILLLPFCLYFDFINYLVTFFLLFEIYYLLKNNNRTLEDHYQLSLRDKNKNNGSLIYVFIKFENKKYFFDTISKLEENLIEYNNIYNSYNDTDNICYCTKNYIYYNKKKFLEDNDYHYKLYIDKKNFKIYTYIKHEYIGGAYLLSLFYLILNKEENQLDIFPKSSLLNLILLPKLYYDYVKLPKIGNDYNLVDDKKEIKRYINHYIMKKNQNVSTKTVLIYNILSVIHKSLNLERSIICYLPIAFQHYKNIKNNIGLIWLIFDPNKDSIEDLDKKINKSKYQALVTNSLMLYKTHDVKRGTEVRKSVDVVLTIMLGKENNDFKVSWTFENVSEYPVYAAVTSIMKDEHIEVTQTITSCIERFEMKDKTFEFIEFGEYKL